MHKLDRMLAPACLQKYAHGRDNWDRIASADKATIRDALNVMQAGRCAYCEASITEGTSHIEHFAPKGKYPKKTFEWPNLFWSCNRQNSCGRYKDHCVEEYNTTDLIKPDIDDPGDFLIFVHDGTIRVREGLSPKQKHRAEETLRVFNLGHQNGALRQMRRAAAAGYLDTAEQLWSLINELTAEQWYELLKDELDAIRHLPFATTIRHALSGTMKIETDTEALTAT